MWILVEKTMLLKVSFLRLFNKYVTSFPPSLQVHWHPTEDRGPNGAVGKGIFDPSFSVALIVTIYGVSAKVRVLEPGRYDVCADFNSPLHLT